MTIKTGVSVKRLFVSVLVVSVTWAASFQPRAEAMLAPSGPYQARESVDRTGDMQTIQKTLESKALRGKLQALGLSDAEIQSRLSRLSDAQVHQMASQIRAVNPAGDFLIGILVAVVLVLLIIFLVKHMH